MIGQRGRLWIYLWTIIIKLLSLDHGYVIISTNSLFMCFAFGDPESPAIFYSARILGSSSLGLSHSIFQEALHSGIKDKEQIP